MKKMELYLMLILIFCLRCDAVEECFTCSERDELTCAQTQTLQLCPGNSYQEPSSCMAISYKERKDGREIDRFVKGCTKSYKECMNQCKHAKFMKRSNCLVVCCNTERCNYAENPEGYYNRKKRNSGGDEEENSSRILHVDINCIVAALLFVSYFINILVNT